MLHYEQDMNNQCKTRHGEEDSEGGILIGGWTYWHLQYRITVQEEDYIGVALQEDTAGLEEEGQGVLNQSVGLGE